MKRITFNHAQQQWDNYDAFHTVLNNGLFTYFATGEFICNSSAPRPEQRRIYEEYGVALTASIDGDYNFFSPAGLPVIQAWLNHAGVSYYMIDLTTMRAVRLDQSKYNRKGLHANVARSCAYFISHDAMPQAHGPCTYSYPDTTPTTAAWIKDFSALIQARAVLMGKPREVSLYKKKLITTSYGANARISAVISFFLYRLTSRGLPISTALACISALKSFIHAAVVGVVSG